MQNPSEHPPCTRQSLDAGEPVAATATAGVRTWLVLEDDGRWGPKALASAELPDAVRERLLELKATPGWRPVLVRPRVADGRRRLWLARTLPGEEALFQWTLDRPEDLLDLPLEPIALGHQDGPRVDGPLVLVCMHGQRDRCCALLGAPVEAALNAARPGVAVRSTHLGGHRFAPTAVALPLGAMFGRLDAADAGPLLDALDERRIFDLDRYRGRVAWDRHVQAALHAHRQDSGDRSFDGVHVIGSIRVSEGRWRVALTGMSFGSAYCEYEVELVPLDTPTHKSCRDASPAPVHVARATRVS